MLVKNIVRSICSQHFTKISLGLSSRSFFHTSIVKLASEPNLAQSSSSNPKTSQTQSPSPSSNSTGNPVFESVLSYLERAHYASPFAKSLAAAGVAQTAGAKPPTESIESLAAAATARERLSDEIRAEALSHPDYFDVRQLVRMEELVAARVHIGHRSIARNAHMAPYLLGSRLDVDIFDLDRTVPLFQDALNFIAHMSFLNGVLSCPLFSLFFLQISVIIVKTISHLIQSTFDSNFIWSIRISADGHHFARVCAYLIFYKAFDIIQGFIQGGWHATPVF